MKYHLKQVLDGKENYYIKPIRHYDRNIGKSTALARLSVKYNIPVVVPTHTWRNVIERDIPQYIPKYFKKKNPMAMVASNDLRGRKYNVLLIEERLTDEQMELVNRLCNGNFVGYRNMD